MTATATTTAATAAATARHPADAPWMQHYSHRQVIAMLTKALDEAELRHEASREVTRLMGEAFLALRRHGIDFTELPGYRSEGCPELDGPGDLNATIGWTVRMRREIKAAAHRRTLGVVVLVSSRKRPRKAAATTRMRGKPLALVGA